MVSCGAKALFIVGVAAGFLGLPTAAGAVTFTGSSGSLAASADFVFSATDLTITLTNTSTADVNDPAGVLTGVFFDLAATLTKSSATLNAGSTVVYDSPGTTNMGGEWAYVGSLSGAPGAATKGISSAGLDLFGPSDRFDTSSNLAGPPSGSPDGVQYGLLSAGWVSTGDNTGITGSGGLIKNSVVFVLLGTFDLDNLPNITNVSFQYGTALDEPNIPGTCTTCGGGIGPPPSEVPLPAALPLFGSALAGAGLLGGWRKRRKAA